MQEPKPCPFCGTTDKVEAYPATVGLSVARREGIRVGCVNPECDINPYTRTIWPTADDAMQSWNRRV